ncbi:MAG: hypothetical protein ACRDHO_11845 [Actinomycetota bacterium]
MKLIPAWCGLCGVDFAWPDWMNKKSREDGSSFYCPNGHRIGYGETENDKLQQRLRSMEARLQHERDQREATERSLAAKKGQVTKLKKRVGKGVCPCCNRHFVNVERHMASEHPEYSEEEA